MTRAEMMHRMAAREYDEWRVYMQLYPAIGERGAYYRDGALVATVQNLFLKEGVPPRTPLHVFPFLDPDFGQEVDEEDAEEELREQAMSPEDWAAFMDAAYGGIAKQA